MADPAAPSLCVSAAPVEEAGRRLAAALQRAIAETGSARLAVPGGSAAAALGSARRALAAQPGGAWEQVRLTWVDERCVPSDDPESNRGAAYRAGWLDAQTPPAREMPLFEDGESPADACARVAAAFAADFACGLDAVLLGMGEDGHVASLFPGRAAPRGAWVAHVPDSPKPPPQRITLTRRALATARTAILVATGEAKRDALSRLLAGDAMLPAVGLPGLIVVTDLQALD